MIPELELCEKITVGEHPVEKVLLGNGWDDDFPRRHLINPHDAQVDTRPFRLEGKEGHVLRSFCYDPMETHYPLVDLITAWGVWRVEDATVVSRDPVTHAIVMEFKKMVARFDRGNPPTA